MANKGINNNKKVIKCDCGVYLIDNEYYIKRHLLTKKHANGVKILELKNTHAIIGSMLYYMYNTATNQIYYGSSSDNDIAAVLKTQKKFYQLYKSGVRNFQSSFKLFENNPDKVIINIIAYVDTKDLHELNIIKKTFIINNDGPLCVNK